MKNITLITALTLAFAPLHGAVITESADYAYSGAVGLGTLNLNQFDTSLGQLTSVTLNWTMNSVITSAYLTNNTGDTATFTNFVVFNQSVLSTPVGDSYGLQHGFQAVPEGSVDVNPGGTYTYSGNPFGIDHFSQEIYVNSSDSNFDSFKGTSTVPLYLSAMLSGVPVGSPATSWSSYVTGDHTAFLTATYTYTPNSGGGTGGTGIAPVPEPSAMILGCGGLFFMVGLASKKRRIAQSKLLSEA